ncbi:uncharacterized protein LOC126833748 [Adelges cooleyi]|uniref:uncharacterized protein LOC126833748 n=1 Tax=Adelges cooleyi TaxID=133065 RepID=UPI00217F5843|nr:uncharacterized protein LOC126833748 [Adelges cooleyi]
MATISYYFIALLVCAVCTYTNGKANRQSSTPSGRPNRQSSTSDFQQDDLIIYGETYKMGLIAFVEEDGVNPIPEKDPIWIVYQNEPAYYDVLGKLARNGLYGDDIYNKEYTFATGDLEFDELSTYEQSSNKY